MLQLDFRRMIDALADPVIAADTAGNIVYANQAVEALLGWPPPELLGRPLAVIQPSRLRAAHTLGFQRFVRTGAGRLIGVPIHVPALHRDGCEIDVELSVTALFAGDDLLVVGTIRDLRERVELERQLVVTRYLQASTAAAAKLTAVLEENAVLDIAAACLVDSFDAALTRLWLVDPETHTLRLRLESGPAAPGPEVSSNGGQALALPTWLAETCADAHIAVLDPRGDERFDQEWVSREDIVCAAAVPLVFGSQSQGIIVHFSRSPLSGESVDVLNGFAAIVSACLNNSHLYRELQEAVRMRNEFLSSMSHDLKNPVATVKIRAQMLRKSAGSLPAESRERFVHGLTSIDANLNRMTRFIDDLTDVARLGVGEAVGLELHQVDLVDLVRLVIADQQFGLETRTISLDVSGESVTGRWDANRLERVITNVLSNALKYSANDGNVSISIRREARGTKAMAVLTVCDSGIGVPAADLPRIFERFYRGSNVVGTFAGSGIGLASGKKIIEQHGGAITVSSVEGQGACFTIELPLPALDPQ